MICRLKGDPLHCHAQYALLHSKKCAKSWFLQVKDICLKYGLPHPLKLLNDPPTRLRLKNLVKTKIYEYWQKLLTSEALPMPSLSHFNPFRHTLLRPHPLWSAAGSSPYEVNKATIHARMISGRYRTDSLCRFWSDNQHGYCLADTCHEVVGDLEHLLLHCPALQQPRQNLLKMWLTKSAALPQLHSLVVHVMGSTPAMRMIFILDPTSMPEIISLHNMHGKVVFDMVLYMARTYVYGLHRKKLILAGKWPYASKNENCNDHINQNAVAGTLTVTRPNVPITRCPSGHLTTMTTRYEEDIPPLLSTSCTRLPMLCQPVPGCSDCPLPGTCSDTCHTPVLVKRTAQLGDSTNPVDQSDMKDDGVPTQPGADKAPDVHELSADSAHVGGSGVEGDAGGCRNGSQHIII